MNWLVEPREALRLWFKIGMLSFGGPAGQIALMHRTLVEERKWIGEERFLHALNFCMLLPGPEAQQLATYIGWLIGGVRGGLAAGGLFVLPGAVVMLVLSILYTSFADTSLLQGIMYGVKAAVVAIVIEALLRIGRRALTGTLARVIAVSAFFAIYFLGAPFPLIVLGAGAIGALSSRFLKRSPLRSQSTSGKTDVAPLIDAALDKGQLTHTRPNLPRALAIAAGGVAIWFSPVALSAALGGAVFTEIGFFFSKMAVVTFGGAYAVLAYVTAQAVEAHHWLTPAQMLHGLGLAETTPGPLILVLQFVGFLAAHRQHGMLDPMIAGALGAAMTLWVTFVPSFLWIFVGAPYAEALRRVPALSAALAGITAAVVGVIANLTLWFGVHALFGTVVTWRGGLIRADLPKLASLDPVAMALALFAAVTLLVLKWPLLRVLGACAVAGALLHLAS